MFLHVWETHMQCEVESEKIRQQIQKLKHFSVHNAFFMVDSNRDNFIDKSDVSKLLKLLIHL